MRVAQAAAAVLLALGVASGASAQSDGSTSDNSANTANTAIVPVFYNNSSKAEAYLLLEPTAGSRSGARWRFGDDNQLDAAFGLQAGDSLALLCERGSGMSAALSSLAGCAIGAVRDHRDDGSRGARATAAFGHDSTRVGISAGNARANLPVWLAPAGRGNGAGDVEINNLTLFAQQDIGREGTVSIKGTVARAELIPAGEAPAALSDRWNTSTLAVGANYGAFGANIIGQVVDTPGQQEWQGLGLGLTWRTPWKGQLTVGADNLVTRGKNPFAPSAEQDEGAVPYVRYEQEL